MVSPQQVSHNNSNKTGKSTEESGFDLIPFNEESSFEPMRNRPTPSSEDAYV